MPPRSGTHPGTCVLQSHLIRHHAGRLRPVLAAVAGSVGAASHPIRDHAGRLRHRQTPMQQAWRLDPSCAGWCDTHRNRTGRPGSQHHSAGNSPSRCLASATPFDSTGPPRRRSVTGSCLGEQPHQHPRQCGRGRRGTGLSASVKLVPEPQHGAEQRAHRYKLNSPVVSRVSLLWLQIWGAPVEGATGGRRQ